MSGLWERIVAHPVTVLFLLGLWLSVLPTLFGWQVVRYGIHLRKVGRVSLLMSIFIN